MVFGLQLKFKIQNTIKSLSEKFHLYLKTHPHLDPPPSRGRKREMNLPRFTGQLDKAISPSKKRGEEM